MKRLQFSLFPEAGVMSAQGTVTLCPKRVCINSSLPPLTTCFGEMFVTNHWNMGFNEGSHKYEGLLFHWYSPILHFFQLYLLRQSLLLNNVGLGSETGMCRRVHLWPETLSFKYHQSALLLHRNTHPSSNICFRHLFHLAGIKTTRYSKCFVYIKTRGVNEYLKPFQ